MKKTRAHRRARRALAWALVAFVAVQLGAGLALDYLWPDVRFPDCRAVLAQLRAQPRPPDVLFLGSSRFGLAVRPQAIQEVTAFNAAVTSGDFLTADCVLARILQAGHRPGLVVLEINPETVCRRVAWIENHLMRQLTWKDLPLILRQLDGAERLHRLKVLAQARLTPLHFYRRELRQQLVRSLLEAPEPPRPSGFDWEGVHDHQGPTPPAERTAVGLDYFRAWMADYQVGGAPTRALDRLFGRCQAAGVPVLLVAPPVSGPHRKLYGPEVEAAFRAEVARVTARFGCQFLDARDAVPDTFFYDNHHLIPEGGRAFSRWLAGQLPGALRSR